MTLALPKPVRGSRPKRPPVDHAALKFGKDIPPRDSDYCAFVRSHGCAIRTQHRCMLPIDAAHIEGHHALGSKASDYATINLCRAGHMRQHAIGWARFEEEYQINRYEIAFRTLEAWIRRGGMRNK
jgi:hypothetical protein